MSFSGSLEVEPVNEQVRSVQLTPVMWAVGAVFGASAGFSVAVSVAVCP